MVTYNVKQAASMFGKSQTWLITRAIRSGIPKTNGQYYLSQDDLKLIQNVEPIPRFSKLRQISLNTGLTENQVRRVSFELGLRFRADAEKIEKACMLWKSEHYTFKGIAHILGLKKFA